MNLIRFKRCLVIVTIVLVVAMASIWATPGIKLMLLRQEAVDLQNNDKIGGILHFSVDDTIEIFKDLTENEQHYDSMFDNRNLAYLRKINEVYGVKISLYCYYEDENGFNLSQATERFKNEFTENSNWLKVGFHSKNYNCNYADTNAHEAKADYDLVLNQLIRICGKECIDTVVRLSMFQGNKESVIAMRECEFGISGLLSADDERGSYYLSSAQEQLLKKEEYLSVDNINYYKTDCRIESIDSLSDTKAMLQNDPKRIVFTHEYCLSGLDYRLTIEELLLDAMKDDYTFSFI